MKLLALLLLVVFVGMVARRRKAETTPDQGWREWLEIESA